MQADCIRKDSRDGGRFRILFYDAQPYDREFFDQFLPDYPMLSVDYLASDINQHTIRLSHGYDAVCLFVASDSGEGVIRQLSRCGVRLILLRCAGTNNVSLDPARSCGITVMRVPDYSPEAVAEHAIALAFAVNRRLHKAYVRVRENNFSLTGLIGINFFGRTAGIIGTGRIGSAMARICRGIGMRVIAYDKKPDKSLDFIEYMPLDRLYFESDLISLHCPLTDESYHMIDSAAIEKMKPGVILVNTSRGALISTEDLIKGIRSRRLLGVGLDVYEEEQPNVFENREDDILESSVTSRLLGFPNVLVTSHQGFLTEDALRAIAKTTLENAKSFFLGQPTAKNTL